MLCKSTHNLDLQDYENVISSRQCSLTRRGGSASSAGRGTGFPWGDDALGSLSAHSFLQFSMLLSQYYHTILEMAEFVFSLFIFCL
jgi:hypothetical protein